MRTKSTLLPVRFCIPETITRRLLAVGLFRAQGATVGNTPTSTPLHNQVCTKRTRVYGDDLRDTGVQ
ncbi:uncharacterized protein EI90DRAFT_3070022 [Cantharellus anzutake]|uniref:uncharacterized protein n=1 Tax=Cantharellus anzutake TaxID=1750568 RepID=UPI0019039A88|nr:uncharacterized protein EI90DRAFT_3070022 [Cantharellus anzutake]KAF8326637.1 hypothetical protein EI90DRAFT_3070022 [Cantharellus anzutake]